MATLHIQTRLALIVVHIHCLCRKVMHYAQTEMRYVSKRGVFSDLFLIQLSWIRPKRKLLQSAGAMVLRSYEGQTPALREEEPCDAW